MTAHRVFGALLGIGFLIVAAAEARGNKVAGGLACAAMWLTYFCINRSAP